jgi:hypothetical protein
MHSIEVKIMKLINTSLAILVFASFSAFAAQSTTNTAEPKAPPTREDVVKAVETEVTNYKNKLNSPEVQNNANDKLFHQDIVQYLEVKLACYKAQTDKYPDESQCVDEIETIGNQGNLMAQEKLGSIYMEKIKDNERALMWFEKASQNPLIPVKDKALVDESIVKLKAAKGE